MSNLSTQSANKKRAESIRPCSRYGFIGMIRPQREDDGGIQEGHIELVLPNSTKKDTQVQQCKRGKNELSVAPSFLEDDISCFFVKQWHILCNAVASRRSPVAAVPVCDAED